MRSVSVGELGALLGVVAVALIRELLRYVERRERRLGRRRTRRDDPDAAT